MPVLENPFLLAQAEVDGCDKDEDHFVDMHAEATSEKIAMARMLRWTGKRRGGHAHARTDGGRTDFPGGTASISRTPASPVRTESVWPRDRAGHKTVSDEQPQRFEVRKTACFCKAWWWKLDEASAKQ